MLGAWSVSGLLLRILLIGGCYGGGQGPIIGSGMQEKAEKQKKQYTYILARGDHPNSRKNTQRMKVPNDNLSCGFPSTPGIAPGVAPRVVVFVLLKSRDAIPRVKFRIPSITFWIPRAAPRIPRNSPRAPRMVFSLRERFFLKLGFLVYCRDQNYSGSGKIFPGTNF